MSMKPPSVAEAKLGLAEPLRCHDLAESVDARRRRKAPQRYRRAAEECAETRGEMAVAGKAGIQRDGRQVAAVEHRVERERQPLLQDVAKERDADGLAEHVAQMKGRQARDVSQPRDAP